MNNDTLNTAKEKMEKAITNFTRELAKVRAGRVNASLLDRITVEYYGAKTPINQMASISIPEPRMLVIQPYDRSIMNEIEKAILKSDLGINPTNDGTVIRLVVPALTEDRRKELVKTTKKMMEEAKVGIRNIRREGNDELKKQEKEASISEDELKKSTNDMQKLTDRYTEKVEQIAKTKEIEIMEV